MPCLCECLCECFPRLWFPQKMWQKTEGCKQRAKYHVCWFIICFNLLHNQLHAAAPLESRKKRYETDSNFGPSSCCLKWGLFVVVSCSVPPVWEFRQHEKNILGSADKQGGAVAALNRPASSCLLCVTARRPRALRTMRKALISAFVTRLWLNELKRWQNDWILNEWP